MVNYYYAYQVAQVLLTLPYSFSQLGMLSGILLQIFYGFMGSWTAYLISVLYVEYRSRKEKEGVNFKNHVIQVLCLSPFFLIIHSTSLFIIMAHFDLPENILMVRKCKFVKNYIVKL